MDGGGGGGGGGDGVEGGGNLRQKRSHLKCFLNLGGKNFPEWQILSRRKKQGKGMFSLLFIFGHERKLMEI